MVPILYDKSETAFTSWGICPLQDVISCMVTEERNGDFLLDLVISSDAPGYKHLEVDRIIKAKSQDKDTGVGPEGIKPEQPFRIYHIGKPINGKITVKAEHVARSTARGMVMLPQANDIVWAESSSSSGRAWPDIQRTGAGQSLIFRPVGYHNATDHVTFEEGDFIWPKHDIPWSGKDFMAGVEGSVLDRNHCEYDYDGYTIYAKKDRGASVGAQIRFGRDMTDFNMETNILNVFTGILPYYYDANSGTYVQGTAVYGANRSSYAEDRLQIFDFSSAFSGTVPTAAQLTTRARSEVRKPGFGVPSLNFAIDFIPIWAAADDMADAVPKVKLCDTVGVYFDRLGITAQAKVIKTEYDVIKERMTKLTLGSEKPSLPKKFAGMMKKTGVTI